MKSPSQRSARNRRARRRRLLAARRRVSCVDADAIAQRVARSIAMSIDMLMIFAAVHPEAMGREAIEGAFADIPGLVHTLIEAARVPSAEDGSTRRDTLTRIDPPQPAPTHEKARG